MRAARALRRKDDAPRLDHRRRATRPSSSDDARDARGRRRRRASRRARGAPSTPDAWTQKTTIQVFVEGRDWSFRGLTPVAEDGGREKREEKRRDERRETRDDGVR